MSTKNLTGEVENVISIIAPSQPEEQEEEQKTGKTEPKRKRKKESPQYIRYTVIAREDLIEQLKGYAMTEGKTVKEITEEMFLQYLADKEINNTFIKYIREKKEK